VDAFGSVVLGDTPAARKLTGIGASQPSVFLMPTSYDQRAIVKDSEAFAACGELDRALGLRVGGSSGAVLFACGKALEANPHWRRVVCLCPDGGSNYESTVFSEQWIIANGFDPHTKPLPIEAFSD
jgi:cysteine synthase A